jgi:hypothetical protein
MSIAAAVSTRDSAAAHNDRRTEPREIYVTPDKLAKFISRFFDSPITTKTLANWRCSGKGPAFVKLGRRVRYDLRAVNRWFETQRHAGAAIK